MHFNWQDRGTIFTLSFTSCTNRPSELPYSPAHRPIKRQPRNLRPKRLWAEAGCERGRPREWRSGGGRDHKTKARLILEYCLAIWKKKRSLISVATKGWLRGKFHPRFNWGHPPFACVIANDNTSNVLVVRAFHLQSVNCRRGRSRHVVCPLLH